MADSRKTRPFWEIRQSRVGIFGITVWLTGQLDWTNRRNFRHSSSPPCKRPCSCFLTLFAFATRGSRHRRPTRDLRRVRARPRASTAPRKPAEWLHIGLQVRTEVSNPPCPRVSRPCQTNARMPRSQKAQIRPLHLPSLAAPRPSSLDPFLESIDRRTPLIKPSATSSPNNIKFSLCMITCQFYFIVAHGGGIEYKNDCRIVRCLLVAGSFLIEKK